MAIEEIGRMTAFADVVANVEDATGALVEIRFGVDTDTGKLGFTIDAGATWTWINLTFPFAVSDTATIDLTWSGGVLSADIIGNGSSTHFEPVTNGDPDNPELLFVNGDVVVVEVNN